MTLSLAVEWAKGLSGGATPDAVIEAAKKFEKHITGSGITPPPSGGILFPMEH